MIVPENTSSTNVIGGPLAHQRTNGTDKIQEGSGGKTNTAFMSLHAMASTLMGLASYHLTQEKRRATPAVLATNIFRSTVLIFQDFQAIRSKQGDK